MAKSDEKWVMFKQFMYNELGISKEDIQDWIQDAVKCEIDKRMNDTFDHFSISDMTKKEINKRLDRYFIRDLTKEIADHYKIIEK